MHRPNSRQYDASTRPQEYRFMFPFAPGRNSTPVLRVALNLFCPPTSLPLPSFRLHTSHTQTVNNSKTIMAEMAKEKEEVSKTDVAKEKDNIHTPYGSKSFVWKYFGFRKDGGKLIKDMAICRKCRWELRYCGNTTNLSAHLRRHHEIRGEEKVQPSTSSLTTLFPQKFANSSKKARTISKAIAFFFSQGFR